MAPTATLGNGGAVNEGSDRLGHLQRPGSTRRPPTRPPASPTATTSTTTAPSSSAASVGDGATVPGGLPGRRPGQPHRRAAGSPTSDGGFTDYTTTITINNVAPTATAVGNGGAVNEGSTDDGDLQRRRRPVAGDTAAGFTLQLRLRQRRHLRAQRQLADIGGRARSLPGRRPGDAHACAAGSTDQDGGFTDYTTRTITINNVAPTATLGNGGPVNEGSTGSRQLQQPVRSVGAPTRPRASRYSYDFDNDGTFEISGQRPTLGDRARRLTWPTARAPAPSAAGSSTSDGGFTDYTTTITINNVAPTATVVTNGGPVNEGSPATVSFTGQSDPSAADTAAGFTYSYDFDNDGTFELSGQRRRRRRCPAPSCRRPGDAHRAAAGSPTSDGGFTDYRHVDHGQQRGADGDVRQRRPGQRGQHRLGQLQRPVRPVGGRHDRRLHLQLRLRQRRHLRAQRLTRPTSATVPGVVPGRRPGQPHRAAAGSPTRTAASPTTPPRSPSTTWPRRRPWSPTAARSTRAAPATVTFSGQSDPSAADTAAGFTYSYDFDNDGTFEISASVARQRRARAPSADGPATRTVAAGSTDQRRRLHRLPTTVDRRSTTSRRRRRSATAARSTRAATGSVSFSSQSTRRRPTRPPASPTATTSTTTAPSRSAGQRPTAATVPAVLPGRRPGHPHRRGRITDQRRRLHRLHHHDHHQQRGPDDHRGHRGARPGQ